MSEDTQVGRPTSYRPEYADQGYKLCLLLGATDADLAAYFEVSESTVNNWKHEFPEFLESIKRGKRQSDAQVAHKLFDRATGAEWVEDQAFKVKKTEYQNGKKVSEVEEIVTVPVRKSAPPDSTAAIFWLKNRASGKWNEKFSAEVSGPNGSPIGIAVEFIEPGSVS